MQPPKDPFDLDEVIKACANHAWNESSQRKEELERRGVVSEGALYEEIKRAVKHPNTQAFSAPYRPDLDKSKSLEGWTVASLKPEKIPDHWFPREVYDLRLDEPRNHLRISFVLNPNRNPETGKLWGGTCFIRPHDRKQFGGWLKQEEKETGVRPEVVIGGRAALCAQYQHRQLVVVPTLNNALESQEQLTPDQQPEAATDPALAPDQQPVAAKQEIDWKRYIFDSDYRRQFGKRHAQEPSPIKPTERDLGEREL